MTHQRLVTSRKLLVVPYNVELTRTGMSYYQFVMRSVDILQGVLHVSPIITYNKSNKAKNQMMFS